MILCRERHVVIGYKNCAGLNRFAHSDHDLDVDGDSTVRVRLV